MAGGSAEYNGISDLVVEIADCEPDCINGHCRNRTFRLALPECRVGLLRLVGPWP